MTTKKQNVITRYLIEVYKIEIPFNGKRRDDISEATEDWLQRNRDFEFQLQGNSLQEMAKRLLNLHERQQ